MMHLVYKINNTQTGMYYVGVHSTNDIADGYMGSGTYLRRAIKKYGLDCFEREVLHICESRNEAMVIEREIVNIDFVSNQLTYNLAIGGGGRAIMVDGDIKTNVSKIKFKRFDESIFYKIRLINYAPIFDNPKTIAENLHNMLVRLKSKTEEGLEKMVNNYYTNSAVVKMLKKGNWVNNIAIEESSWDVLTN